MHLSQNTTFLIIGNTNFDLIIAKNSSFSFEKEWSKKVTEIWVIWAEMYFN